MFSDDVRFYLNMYKNTVSEEDEAVEAVEGGDEGGEDEGSEASCKTKKCPVCGKTKCVCKASKSTNTVDDDDGDEVHCSTETKKKQLKGDLTPEEEELLKFSKGKGSSMSRGKGMAPDMGDTPEEKEMLELMKSKKSCKSTKTSMPNGFSKGVENKDSEKDCKPLPDDHCNGRSSCKTEKCPKCGKDKCECTCKTVKESLFGFLSSKSINESNNDKAKKIQELVKSKKVSKELLKKCGKNKKASEAFRKISIAEDKYINDVPGALLEYKKLVKEYGDLL